MVDVCGAGTLARSAVRGVLLALCAAGSTALAGELEDAEAALHAGQVAQAEAALQRLALDEQGDPRTRAEAGVSWALLPWRIDGQPAVAAQRLARLRTTPDSLCLLATARVRLAREAVRLDELRTALQHLPPFCGRAVDLHRLQLQAAAGWLLRVQRDNAADRPAAYRAGLQWLTALDDLAGLDLKASELALAYAVAARDAPAAESAWKTHFRGSAGAAAEGLDLVEVFTRGLAPAALPTERLPLLTLLIKAGFSDTARAFADSHGLLGLRVPAARAAAVYLALRAELETTAQAFNRAHARGRVPDRKRYDEALQRSLSRAARALAGRTAAGSPVDTRETLRREFGLWTSTGVTNGVGSLHAGHVVADQAHAVNQFGRQAQVRLVVLDQMIANGYATWVSDGASTVGGWAVDGATIVHVRAPYEAGALRRLALRRGGAERAESDRSATALAADDLQAAVQPTPSQLPGLALRLRGQAVDQVDDFAQRGARGAATPRDRALAFVAAWTEQEVARAVVIHEGRHVLDQLNTAGAQLDGAELERRAKLSELQFGPFPRAAFASINDGLTGTDSPHGTANAQVMAGYRRWIETHAAEVEGFDPAQPALTQLDRLSDRQLRGVAAGMDPGFGAQPAPPAAQPLRQMLRSWRQVWDAVRHRLVRP